MPDPVLPARSIVASHQAGPGIPQYGPASIATTARAALAARSARAAGADPVATTLSGYTSAAPAGDGPDIDLVRRLAGALDCPVVAERRFWTPEDVLAGFDAGAHAIVVGTAVTDPTAVTRRLAAIR